MDQIINVDLTKYITEQALILIPVLYVLGMIIKRSAIKDNYIPWILLLLGVALAFMVMGLSVDAFIQGVLVTGTTIGLHQLIKQTVELKPTANQITPTVKEINPTGTTTEFRK